MDAKLLVITGKKQQWVNLRLPTVLGRGREADLAVPHPLISRRHCELFEHEGLLILRDLGSLNGTMLEGRRIALAPLPPGATFTIGPLHFQAQYEYGGDLSDLPAVHYVDEPAAEVENSVENQASNNAAGDELPEFLSMEDEPPPELPKPARPKPEKTKPQRKPGPWRDQVPEVPSDVTLAGQPAAEEPVPAQGGSAAGPPPGDAEIVPEAVLLDATPNAERDADAVDMLPEPILAAEVPVAEAVLAPEVPSDAALVPVTVVPEMPQQPAKAKPVGKKPAEAKPAEAKPAKASLADDPGFEDFLGGLQ